MLAHHAMDNIAKLSAKKFAEVSVPNLAKRRSLRDALVLARARLPKC